MKNLLILLLVVSFIGCKTQKIAPKPKPVAQEKAAPVPAPSAAPTATPSAAQKSAKTALTELFLELRTDTTPAIVERIVNDIDAIVNDGLANVTCVTGKVISGEIRTF